ncbi:hypothetical protein K3495_g15784 [Podosphaera aphanis]|nr:hypothetical protein K3495_g15784 [Podosphaera aphanis]
MDEKKDMEQQEQVEQQIIDAECIRMIQEMRSGTVTHDEFNAFSLSSGPTSSRSTEVDTPTTAAPRASRFDPGRGICQSIRHPSQDNRHNPPQV